MNYIRKVEEREENATSQHQLYDGCSTARKGKDLAFITEAKTKDMSFMFKAKAMLCNYL